MKNKIFCLLMSAGLFLPALAEKPPLTLVTYADISAPQIVDNGPSGPSAGDLYIRHGKVRLTPDGPDIGTYDSLAILLFIDETTKFASRRFTFETVLPEGTIYALDIVQSTHGRPKEAGHKHQGAIIGGTGKYAGARGTYETEILASGKQSKTTRNFWVGQ